MRVALLSLMEPAGSDPQAFRGYLPIGGRSILRHQLGLVLALGCTRVVVFAEALTGELVALQHVTEQGGARFHVIASARALVPLVSPEDELIVLADGLLAMPGDALPLLEEAPGVLALPVETGLAAGFERIDLNHAAAGAMRLPGRVVAGLGDLPPEWNPAAALLRIAVQGRLPLRTLPAALVDAGHWQLVRTEEEAHRLEPGWLRLHTQSAHIQSPGQWLAALAVRRLGPALLHAGTRPAMVALSAALTAMLGAGAGWFGWIALGLLLMGAAWLVLEGASLLARIERDSLLARSGRAPLHAAMGLLIDGGLVTLCAWRSEIPALPGVPWGLAWFAPLVLLLLVRLLPRLLPREPWTWWLGDRLLAALLLAIASAAAFFDLALRLAALVLLLAAWGAALRQDRAPNPELTSRE